MGRSELVDGEDPSNPFIVQHCLSRKSAIMAFGALQDPTTQDYRKSFEVNKLLQTNKCGTKEGQSNRSKRVPAVALESILSRGKGWQTTGGAPTACGAVACWRSLKGKL